MTHLKLIIFIDLLYTRSSDLIFFPAQFKIWAYSVLHVFCLRNSLAFFNSLYVLNDRYITYYKVMNKCIQDFSQKKYFTALKNAVVCKDVFYEF